jgi:hypothetical protein
MEKNSFSISLILIIFFLSPAFSVTANKIPSKSSAKKTINTAPTPTTTPNTAKNIPAQLKGPVKNIVPVSGWFINFGYLGSAGTIAGGYEKALNERASLLLDTGYGLGNNYMLAMVKGTFILKFKNDPDRWNPFFGLEANYTNYSKKVIDVPGVNSIEKAFAAGGGILFGLNKNDLSFTIGYDSHSGYMAGIGYKIGR